MSLPWANLLRMISDELYRHAVASGVTFYDHPDKLREDQVDPLIWKAVRRINQSNWVWTAESCQGHPDATSHAWAWNVRPMLRLVTTQPNQGQLFRYLYTAMLAENLDDGSPAGAIYEKAYQSFLVYPHLVKGAVGRGSRLPTGAVCSREGPRDPGVRAVRRAGK